MFASVRAVERTLWICRTRDASSAICELPVLMWKDVSYLRT